MNIILQSILYVVNDPYFLPAMALTAMIGIFVGAVVYDGEAKEAEKFVISSGLLVILILATNLTRAIPDIPLVDKPFKPIASAFATILVTLFYLVGMYVGVRITKHAHRIVV